MRFEKLPVWEKLAKELTFAQLGLIKNQTLLDFGSGNGATASHYAKDNAVFAVEPDENALIDRVDEHPYTQIAGDAEVLTKFPTASFDTILCHNVLEYAKNREAILKEFSRLLKPHGVLSILKHNVAGRVFQTSVLLNDFDRAEALLTGSDGYAERYGAIRYYEDGYVSKVCPAFVLKKCYGQRVFFDLQQNQEIQKDRDWQIRMLKLEQKVSEIDVYRNAAFFHHLIFEKSETESL